MQVLLPRRLARKFYSLCKKNFPVETYALLLGRILRSGGVEVVDLYIPDDQAQFCTKDRVEVQLHWLIQARSLAKVKKLKVVGDIHSHCYDDIEGFVTLSEPSEGDWNGSKSGQEFFGTSFSVFGVCRVLKKAGRKTCRTKFWPPIDPPTLKIL